MTKKEIIARIKVVDNSTRHTERTITKDIKELVEVYGAPIDYFMGTETYNMREKWELDPDNNTK